MVDMRRARGVKVGAVLAAGAAALTLAAACGPLLGVKEITIDSTDDTPIPDAAVLAEAGADSGAEGGGGGCTFAADCPALTTTPAKCAVSECSAGKCVYHAIDKDQDGHPTTRCEVSQGIVVEITLGDDCDDGTAQLYPGHPMDCAEGPDGGVLTFPGGQPVGACKFGKKSCLADGTVSPCVGAVGPTPVTSCTPTIDEACTGNATEGCTCTTGQTTPCGTSSVGVCVKGISTCLANNTFGPCVGNIEPGPRNCAAATDNDCNGAGDNGEAACQCPGGGAPGTARACNTHPQDGTGACVPGSQTCTPSGSSSAYSACSGDVGPQAEVCDGVDRDCNGIAGVNEPADPAPQPPVSTVATMNCTKVFRCPNGRGALYYRNGVGWTNFAGTNTVWTGYAPQGSYSAGTFPPGTYRISRDGTGTKMGPVTVASACCGAGGCPTANVYSDGAGQFYTLP